MVVTAGFVDHLKVVFLQLEAPSGESGSRSSVHRILHGMEPSKGTVISDYFEVFAPQVTPPLLDGEDHSEQFHFRSGIVSFCGAQSTSCKRDWAFLTVVVELHQDAADAVREGTISFHGEFSIESGHSQHRLSGDRVDQCFERGLALWALALDFDVYSDLGEIMEGCSVFSELIHELSVVRGKSEK